MAGEKEQDPPKKKKKRKKRKERERPGLISRAVGSLMRLILRLLWAVGWRLAVIGAFVVGVATGYYYLQLPAVERLFDGRGGGSVTMLDRNGTIFAWRGEQYGGDLGINEVSPHLIHAVVAAEDRRYFDHFGIDPLGIARAM